MSPPTEAQAAAWLEFFASVNPEDFLKAIKSHIATNKFIPCVADLNELLNPPKNDFGAQKIIQAIGKFGSYDEIGAKAYLGDLWPAVERYGWKNLCLLEVDQLPTITAQLKQVVEVINKRNTESASLQRLDNSRESLEVIGMASGLANLLDMNK